MTSNQKRKQARHNAAKDNKRRKLSEAEMDKRFSDLRKQEAEANEKLQKASANLEDTFREWTQTYNWVVAPAISLAALVSFFEIADKYLIRSMRDSFAEAFCEAMQGRIDLIGEDKLTWQQLQDELYNKYGYTVPQWAGREGDADKWMQTREKKDEPERDQGHDIQEQLEQA